MTPDSHGHIPSGMAARNGRRGLRLSGSNYTKFPYQPVVCGIDPLRTGQ